MRERSRHNHEEGARARRGAIGILLCHALLQIAGVPSLILHKSVNPAVLGRYSSSYLVLMLVYAAGIVAAIALLLRLIKSQGIGKTSPMPWLRPAFILGTAIWWGAAALAGYVNLATHDTDFRHAGYLLFACWPMVAWAWTFVLGGRFRLLADKLAIAVGSALVMVLMIEAALHILPMNKSLVQFRRDQLNYLAFNEDARLSESGFQSALELDPELGWRMLPNLDRTVDTAHGAIASTRLVTNQWGYYGAPLDLKNSYDVVTIGDSFTANAWPDFLAESTGWRLANLGVPGYGPPQYNINIRRHALRLKPRVIVYGLYLNDPMNCADYEDWRQSGKDWFSYMGGMWFGAPQAHPGRVKLKEIMLRRSWLVAMGQFAVFTHSQKNQGFLSKPIAYDKGNLKLTFDRASFESLGNPEDPKIRRGFEILGRCLREAKADCDRAGVELLVFLFPSKEWVYRGQLASAATEAEKKELGRMAEFQRRMEEICGRSGVDWVDAGPGFEAEAAKGGRALYREIDIHWTPEGEHLMAELARREIERRQPGLKRKESRKGSAEVKH